MAKPPQPDNATMKENELEHWLTRAAAWSAEYRRTVESRPVRAQVQPGDISQQIAESPPREAESMEDIFRDFEEIIPAGMTHWQHPRFFAYFQSNSAPAAFVAEVLVTAIGAQCMLWQTSPAATELEVRMIDWLRQATGLPDDFKGVLQDTASTSTLCAILTMREIATDFKGNEEGLFNKPPIRIYASERTHSSIDKALWIAGLGQNNLVKIATNESYAMDADHLRNAIKADRDNGLTPGGVVVCVGGTSIGATDNVREICEIAKQENLYTHVDAAWAGSAMICPEYRHLWDGIELADSIVWNPHKWLGVPMECSAHFVRDPATLVKTLAIQPAYLETHGKDGIINFSEWGIALGRRFRALKLWFLLRAYGLDGLQQRIRNHIKWSEQLAKRLRQQTDFEIVTAPMLSLFSFRYVPEQLSALDDDTKRAKLADLNARLLAAINDDGTIYLTQSDHDGDYVIRFVAGQFDLQASDIDRAFESITALARNLPVIK